MLYQIFLSLHLISLISWFAGLFYLPRLFVYHVRAHEKSQKMLVIMEAKLQKYIMCPAMLSTWVFGLSMLYQNPYLLQEGWFHIKLTLVTILTVYHFSLHKFRQNFANNCNEKSERFFRIYNEVPTIILITVVFLVILKP